MKILILHFVIKLWIPGTFHYIFVLALLLNFETQLIISMLLWVSLPVAIVLIPFSLFTFQLVKFLNHLLIFWRVLLRPFKKIDYAKVLLPVEVLHWDSKSNSEAHNGFLVSINARHLFFTYYIKPEEIGICCGNKTWD